MSEPKSFDELLWKFGKAQRDAGLYGAADNVEKYKRSCFEAEQLKAALVEMNRRAPGAGQAVLPSEAIFAFCGWLTSRNATIEFGPRCDCAAVADLVQRFCDSQGFEAPRNEVYPHNLKEYPADEPQAQAEPAEGQEPVFYAAKENIDSPNPNAFTLVSGIKDAEYTEPLYAQPQRPAVPDAAREICRLLDDGIEIHPSAPLHLRLKKELTAAPAPERPEE